MVWRKAGRRAPRAMRNLDARAMGRSAVNLDRALTVAADIEDEELLRRMRLGS